MQKARRGDGTIILAEDIAVWGSGPYTCPKCGRPVVYASEGNTMAHHIGQVQSPKPHFRHHSRYGAGPECR
jgi:hypothetical protein